MSYNIKLSDYSLLPKRAIPLDARSHFKSFAQANKAISGNVTTVENSSETENDYKQLQKSILYKRFLIVTLFEPYTAFKAVCKPS